MLKLYPKNEDAPLKGGAPWINLNPAPGLALLMRCKKVSQNKPLLHQLEQRLPRFNKNVFWPDIGRRSLHDSERCPELTICEMGSEGPVTACPDRDSLALLTPASKEGCMVFHTGRRLVTENRHAKVKQTSPQYACPEGGRGSGSGVLP